MGGRVKNEGVVLCGSIFSCTFEIEEEGDVKRLGFFMPNDSSEGALLKKMVSGF